MTCLVLYPEEGSIAETSVRQDSLNNHVSITIFYFKTTLGSNCRVVRKLGGSRNRDFTVCLGGYHEIDQNSAAVKVTRCICIEYSVLKKS